MDNRSEILIGFDQAAYGVEVSRLRSERAGSFRQEASASHTVFVQLSGPVRTTTRLGRRRLQHRPRRRSIGIAPVGVESQVQIDGPLEGIVLSVSAECLALAAAQTARHGAPLLDRLCGQDDVLFEIASALDAQAAAGQPADALLWSGAVDAMIRRLADRHMDRPARPYGHELAPPTLRRLDDFVEANMALNLDLPALAAVAGCDLFHFARGFRAATGLTPHRYVMRLRLERARGLMREGNLSLADIAGATGFCDQSHMSRWLRRVYGHAPGAIASRRRDCKKVQDGC